MIAVLYIGQQSPPNSWLPNIAVIVSKRRTSEVGIKREWWRVRVVSPEYWALDNESFQGKEWPGEMGTTDLLWQGFELRECLDWRREGRWSTTWLCLNFRKNGLNLRKSGVYFCWILENCVQWLGFPSIKKETQWYQGMFFGHWVPEGKSNFHTACHPTLGSWVKATGPLQKGCVLCNLTGL